MAETETTVDAARYSGSVDLIETDPMGMITIRGDLSDTEFKDVLQRATGLEIPPQRQSSNSESDAILWMSTDELLLLCPLDEAEARMQALDRQLNPYHHLILNVSDARIQITLAGDGAAIREILAKLSPADMRRSALPVGEVRRSRVAQVPAAFWFVADDRANLICFRSVGKYVWDLLTASSSDGSRVEYF